MPELLYVLVTAYCSCVLCTGHTHGITKSGRAASSLTAACDRKLMGAVLVTPWGVRVCEDTGGKIQGKRVDLYLASHEEALKFGVRRVEIERLSW